MRKVVVRLGERSYPVLVGDGIWKKELPRLAHAACGAHGRLFVFCDAQWFALYGKGLTAIVRKVSSNSEVVVLPPGERAKTMAELNKIYSYLLDSRISRNDVILACGGGVTSDVAGFAAATVLRGVRWAVLSTTLLGMVDAAIGGKTGINHKQGKNLLGAIWQPSFVICDSAFLATLPPRDLVAGLGEVAKYAGLTDGEMLGVLDRYLNEDSSLSRRTLTRLIYHSARYKADIVSKDEREGGLRMFLNLGHTFGHAIERTLGYGRIVHGEAVLLGLLAAVELSGRLKKVRVARLAGYRNVIYRLAEKIPHRYIDVEKAIAAMSHDKKRVGRQLRFVLLEAPGRPIIADNVKKKDIRWALKKALATY